MASPLRVWLDTVRSEHASGPPAVRSPSASAAAPERHTASLVEPTPRPISWPDPITRQIALDQAALWISHEAETIPGVRRALHVIAGTVSGLSLSAWRGNTRLPSSVYPWLAQPDPERTSAELLGLTIRDGIWHDTAYWRQTGPGRFRRISPDRITPVHDPSDVDAVGTHLLDGREVPADQLVTFRWAGLGGLRRLGAPLLEMYLRVMEAAGRYADEPVPSAVLRSTGSDLLDDEIVTLIDQWEAARRLRTTAYLNSAVTLETPGYNARDLQLVELTEAIVRDVARLFGLPARALNAAEPSSSMTYANTVESRRDILEAIAPWAVPIEQTLSMDTVTYHAGPAGVTTARAGRWVAYGTDVRFDTTQYLADPWPVRIDTLAKAIAAVGPDGTPLMSVAEARALEPTIPSATPEAAP